MKTNQQINDPTQLLQAIAKHIRQRPNEIVVATEEMCAWLNAFPKIAEDCERLATP